MVGGGGGGFGVRNLSETISHPILDTQMSVCMYLYGHHWILLVED